MDERRTSLPTSHSWFHRRLGLCPAGRSWLLRRSARSHPGCAPIRSATLATPPRPPTCPPLPAPASAGPCPCRPRHLPWAYCPDGGPSAASPGVDHGEEQTTDSICCSGHRHRHRHRRHHRDVIALSSSSVIVTVMTVFVFVAIAATIIIPSQWSSSSSSSHHRHCHRCLHHMPKHPPKHRPHARHRNELRMDRRLKQTANCRALKRGT